MDTPNPPRPDAEAPANESGAALSALADGDATALIQGCSLWRDDPQARATWHAYHLIGDVLRSDDLATSPARDAAFLAALRARLAAEPIVLAPAARTPATRRRPGWLLPAAAGFAAVAGVMLVVRLSAPVADDTRLAAGPQPPSQSGLVLTGDAALPAQPALILDGRMIRDARLDSYLRAHREALGGAPAAVPGGLQRGFDPLSPGAPVVIQVAR